MKNFYFVVRVRTDTDEHALQVIGERVSYDEELEDDEGVKFDYEIDVARTAETR